MQATESFLASSTHFIPASHPQQEEVAIKLSPEEVQARLERNALFLSEENQRVWSALLAQEWFADICELSIQHGPIAKWIDAIERIAQGHATAPDVKQAVFYRSVFRQAQAQADNVQSDMVANALVRLSRYLTEKLRPQHNHFG